MMSENIDGPVVVRRRRKIIRQHREKTPEPTIKSGGAKTKYSDDESSSTAEQNGSNSRPRMKSVSTGPGISIHRSKILSRRDKGIGTSAFRSQSTPRVEGNQEYGETLISRPVKHRSLSSPRQKDESSESSRSSPHHFDRDNSYSKRQMDQKETESKELSKLERNLRRFEEERRKFELEKRKFDREKREMDRIRYRRLEDFERKRMERKMEEAKLPDEHIQHYRVFDTGNDAHQRHDPETDKMLGKLSPILKKPRDLKLTAPQDAHQRTMSPSKTTTDTNGVIMPLPNNEISPPNTPVCDDYESSTAMSSSSREGDFDEIDFSKLPVIDDIKSPLTVPTNDIQTKETPPKLGWISRFFRKKPPQQQAVIVKSAPAPIKELHCDDNMSTVSLLKFFFMESRVVWRQLLSDHAIEWEETKLLRNKCIADLILLTIFIGTGGMIFRFVEGAFENFYKCGVRRVKRDFVDYLWTTSHNLREDEWKQAARNKLRKFEDELQTAHEAGMTSYSGMKAWSFINGIIYCITVVTTIGYGHLTPKTKAGKMITIVYAIIGIPMFLILLADFGKLFTRGIKFMWAYVRRLYYTGSCRKVRKQAQVQDVLRGMNMAYEIATFRRPSMMMKSPDVEEAKEDGQSPSSLSPPLNQESPITPMPPDVNDIDDEFNLPISLAFFLLLTYILAGAGVYTIWEDWSFFEACYFVFISMSTIGFGDYVPNHPAFMMMSILYLIFGLALTSMCINVIQVKLSDSFRHATAKIGATIGLSLAEEEGNAEDDTPSGSKEDIPSVHSSSLKVNTPKVVIDEPPPPPPRKSDTLAADNDKSKTKSKK
ncbi:hypothetical protein HA402_008431 [Bradysia odoriphaga]|nr:hypothetical protein HA402_008431 [Bradysia odoriphaga]